MRLEDLKEYLETRNEIYFRYEFLSDSLRSNLVKNNNPELYYLKTKPDREGRTIEIYLDHNAGSEERVFNLYKLAPEGETSAAYLRCQPKRIEEILRDELGIRRRSGTQARLF